MKINLLQVLMRVDEDKPYLTTGAKMVVGNTIVPNPESKELTLRLALIAALDNEPESSKLEFKQQMRRFHLAKKIRKNDELELSAGDIALLQKVASKKFTPMLTGVIAEALEPGKEPTETEKDPKDSEE